MIREKPIKTVYKNDKWDHENFICSKCKHSERVTPEFKKKYYTPKGDLIITCPKCGQKYFLPY